MCYDKGEAVGLILSGYTSYCFAASICLLRMSGS